MNSIRFVLEIIETITVVALWRIRWVAGNRFYGLPHLSGRSLIRYGKNFRCISRTGRNSIGVIQRCRLTVFPGSAGITFGDDCGISGVAISSRASVKIGSRVLIGSGVLIIDNDAHGLLPHTRERPECIGRGPIIIDDDVFIGARAIILKGVTIGRGAVIGAGAVVVKDVAAFTVVAGNPARVIKKLNFHES